MNGIKIETTDFYVRFKIKSADEYDILANDLGLELFPYPLDYDYGDEEGVIMDPEYGDKPEWLYTVVGKDFQFPDIHKKIIDEVFMPRSYKKQNSGNKNVSDILNILEQKSYELCGLETIKRTLKASPVFPTGTITVWNDTQNQWEPVVGVKVRGRKFLSYGYGFTDEDGVYTLDEDFTDSVSYSMIMENDIGFKIWNKLNFITPAIYEFKKGPAVGKDLECWEGLEKWRWASCNNAIYKYYEYCDSAGIASPPSDLKVLWWEGTQKMGSAGMLHHVFGSSWVNYAILIYDFLNGPGGLPTSALFDLMTYLAPDLTITVDPDDISSIELNELVTHESSHASHYEHVGNSFWIDLITAEVAGNPYGDGTESYSGIIQLTEAWAYYHGEQRGLNKFGVGEHVNGFTTFDDFTPLDTGTAGDFLNYGYYGTYWEGWIPSGIIWDLMDTRSDYLRSTYTDNVTGYSISEIHNAMDSDVDDMQKFKARLLSENSWRDYDDLLDLFRGYFYY